MRRAMGLMAGPDNPPVTVDNKGLRVFALIDIPTNVFISETESAPDSSTASANSTILVTLGESLTISDLEYTSLTAFVTAIAEGQCVPKIMPPSLTLGQEIFNSIALIFSNLSTLEATSQYSSIEAPLTFTTISVSYFCISG